MRICFQPLRLDSKARAVVSIAVFPSSFLQQSLKGDCRDSDPLCVGNLESQVYPPILQ